MSLLIFLQKELPDVKINKQFVIHFYQILVENVSLFPAINEKKETKKNIIHHLQKNFQAFQEHYIKLYIKLQDSYILFLFHFLTFFG